MVESEDGRGIGGDPDRTRYATLDLSAPRRSALDTMIPHAVQVADPFRLVKLANTELDQCRRRVQSPRSSIESAAAGL